MCPCVQRIQDRAEEEIEEKREKRRLQKEQKQEQREAAEAEQTGGEAAPEPDPELASMGFDFASFGGSRKNN